MNHLELPQEAEKSSFSGVMLVGLSLLFLFFLKPTVGNTLEFLGLPPLFSQDTYNALLVAAAFGCIGFRIYRGRVDLLLGLIMVAVAWIAVVTFKNAGDPTPLFTDWLPLLATVCLVSALLGSYRRELLNAMLFACVFYLLLNLVDIFREGSIALNAQTYLPFAIKTATFRIAFPAITCSLLLDGLDGKRLSLSSLAVYLLCVFEVYVGYSATTMVALVLLGLFIVLGLNCKIRRLLNSFTMLAVNACAFIGVVVLRVQNHLAWFIQGVLHKSITLTGRVAVWDEVFHLLSNSHFVWGYGASYLWSTIYVNSTWYKHAHNDLLHLFMLGGIVLVLLVLVILFLTCKQLYEGRENKPCFILSCGLACFLLEGLFEITPYVGFFFVLAMSYYWGMPSSQPIAVCDDER